jgi:hypothetical protein
LLDGQRLDLPSDAADGIGREHLRRWCGGLGLGLFVFVAAE